MAITEVQDANGNTFVEVEKKPRKKAVAAEPKKSSTDVLAEIMLKREAKEEEAKLAKEAKYDEADKKRRIQDAQVVAQEARRAQYCDHLQGNHKPGEAPFMERSHLSLHTFQNNLRRIRCNKCGFRWFPGDTAETLMPNNVRGNREQQVNPTGIGWQEAYRIVLKSKSVGNKPSTGFITVNVEQPKFEG